MKIVCNHNVLYERNKFYKAKQQQNETIEHFLDRLRNLALTCNFAEEENMIRDFLVLRLKDPAPKARLFRKQEEPMLKIAVDELKISEITKRQLQDLNGESEDTQPINYASHASRAERFQQQHFQRDSARDHDRDCEHHEREQIKDCIYCGKSHKATKNACPAYGQICKKCGKRDHFSKVCFVNNKSAVNMMSAMSSQFEHAEVNDDYWSSECEDIE